MINYHVSCVDKEIYKSLALFDWNNEVTQCMYDNYEDMKIDDEELIHEGK